MSGKNLSLSEFQVVVMAGGLGNRMHPLTEQIPKALIPIANKPMIAYSLMALERAGFSEAIVVAKTSHRAQMSKFLKEVYSGVIHVDLHWIENDCGTADALRQIKDKIKKDFIVISSDLITDAPFHRIVDHHRIHNAACTSMVFDIPKGEDGKKVKIEPGLLDYFGLVKERVVYVVSAADMEDENLQLRRSLVQNFHNITVYTNLMNAHLFVFKRWVIDLLVEKTTISTIQAELFPFLVKCQSRTAKKYDVSHLIPPNPQQESNALSNTDVKTEDVKCVVYKLTNGYCIRTNTVPNYMEANRQIVKGVHPNFVPAEKIHKNSVVDPKAQVGNDSIVGDGTKIEEKTSIKKSVIGNHCSIGKNVKITNCVIMNHVVIEDGCKLDGVIASDNSNFKENSSLKDCEVVGCTIEKGTTAKNEKFVETRSLSNE